MMSPSPLRVRVIKHVQVQTNKRKILSKRSKFYVMFLNAIAYCLHFYEKPYNFMVNYFAIRYACRKHASKVKNEKG